MKLRVGDIEMDSNGEITFNHPSQSPVPPANKPAAGLTPARTSTLFAVGLAFWAVAAALIGTFVVGPAWSLPTSVAFGCASWVFWRKATRHGQGLSSGGATAADSANPVKRTRELRIEAMLSTEQSPVTIERIARGLGWTEGAVVDGLQGLVAKQRVVEDLDLESGDWTYAIPHLQRALDVVKQRAMPVEERAAQFLEESEAIVASEKTLFKEMT